MRRGLVTAVGLCVAVLPTTGDAAPSAPARAWTLAEARSHLAALQPFDAVDASQPDRPRFSVRVDRIATSTVRPVGRATIARGVRKWSSFRFAGLVTDLLTAARIHVAFTFAPGPVRGLRIRGFRGPPANAFEPTLPLRAAFYYGWFPELWAQGGVSPYTEFRPSLGHYSSGDPVVLGRHVDAMQYGGLGVGIWSWWGVGDPTDVRFPTALAVARQTPFRWAVYHEREGYGDPSVAELRRDLEYIRDVYGAKPSYLRLGGRAVVFVYSADDVDCEVTERWIHAKPGGVYVVMKVFGGYRDCPVQPDGWHQYGASFATGINRQEGYSTTVMPGFWLVGRQPSALTRDLDRWRRAVREMAASQDPFQLVVSFNEWGEGTAVESADEWSSPSGYGSYLDVLHEELAAGP